jgi:hypothetical protein
LIFAGLGKNTQFEERWPFLKFGLGTGDQADL